MAEPISDSTQRVIDAIGEAFAGVHLEDGITPRETIVLVGSSLLALATIWIMQYSMLKPKWKYLCLAAIYTACSCGSDKQPDMKEQEYTAQLTRRSGQAVTKRMLIDTNSPSAELGKPAFLAPPPGSKPYHGFPLLEGVAIDGFKLGTVTDYRQPDCTAGCTIGDAFVEAPDGTRAGLVWEVGEERMFSRFVEPDTNRWGVYYFSFAVAVKSTEDFRKNFLEVLPKLKQLYQTSKDEL